MSAAAPTAKATAAASATGVEIASSGPESAEPTGMKSVSVKASDLSEQDQAKLKEMPDPEPLLTFAEAVQKRKPAGGNAEAAYRTVAILHLTNIAIRVGRKIRFDPVTEQIVGDEEANRLINQPMRAPWQL